MKILKKILITLPTVILVMFLVLVVHISVSLQKQKVPQVFGFSFHIVQTGSMEPEILIGDFIISKSQKSYSIGEAVSFYYDYDHDGVKESVTHQIIDKEGSTITLRGVAASEDDIQIVEESDIYGKVIYQSTSVGKFFSKKLLQNKQFIFLVISVGLGIFAVFQFVDIVKLVKHKEE